MSSRPDSPASQPAGSAGELGRLEPPGGGVDLVELGQLLVLLLRTTPRSLLNGACLGKDAVLE